MIVSLISSDIKAVAATDLLVKKGIESGKISLNAVEQSFAQILLRFETGVSPLFSQIDVVDSVPQFPQLPKGNAASDDKAAADESTPILAVMTAPFASTETALSPDIAAVEAASEKVETADEDVLDADPSASMPINSDVTAAFGAQPSSFWGVTLVTRGPTGPADLAVLDDHSLVFQPFVTDGQSEALQQVDLSLGGMVFPFAAYVADPSVGDGTFATNDAADVELSDGVTLVLGREPLFQDNTIIGPLIEMPGAYISDVVKKLTRDGWKVTDAQMVHDASYQLVEMNAGLGLDPLSFPRVVTDTGMDSLLTRRLGVQSEVVSQTLTLDPKITSAINGAVTVFPASVIGSETQAGFMTLYVEGQAVIAPQAVLQWQAAVPTAGSGEELLPSTSKAQSVETTQQLTPSKPLAEMRLVALKTEAQTGASVEAAADAQGDIVPQQPASRVMTASQGDGASALFGTDRGPSPNPGDKKQKAGLAQNGIFSEAAPAKAATNTPVSKGFLLAGGVSARNLPQMTLSVQQQAVAVNADPLPTAMTPMDVASGGAGSIPQGGSGQTGSGVAGQGAASLQSSMEAALDVRQQGWTKALVNRAISAAQSGGALTIKILPAHLGQITVKLSEGKRGTDLRIIADVPATASMLRDVQQQLSSAFYNAGLTLGEYSASTGKGGDQGAGAQKDGDTDQLNAFDTAIEAVTSAQSTSREDTLSRLNILL